jgi:hypothetical protein
VLARLAEVGVEPGDDEEARLREGLLGHIAILILPIAVAGGLAKGRGDQLPLARDAAHADRAARAELDLGARHEVTYRASGSDVAGARL